RPLVRLRRTWEGAKIMSHSKPEFALPRQFCRPWNGRRVGIKFLSEMTARELERLAIEYGERAVAGLPACVAEGLDGGGRRRPGWHLGCRRVKQLARQRKREQAERASQPMRR